MESLIGYGSDDDSEEIVQTKKQSSSQVDVNYEEVQMDLSEESNDSSNLGGRRQSSDFHSKNKDVDTHTKEKDQYKKSLDDHSKYRSERGRYSPKYQDSRKEDKYRDRNRNEDDRYKRDDKEKDDRSRDYRKDKYRDDKSRYKDDRGRESRKTRDEQDKSRESRGYESRDSSNKDERRSYRNSSRDRHRSRSPRRSDYRSRRSSSRDRGYSGYSKRYDRTSSKMDRLEKLGIELNTSNSGFASTSNDSHSTDKQQQEKDRFYMPGITGRFTEQIQRRKLLWQKKDNKSIDSSVENVGNSSSSTGTSSGISTGTGSALQSSKVWQNTTFAQDTDGKVATKFKRLMGIRSNENDTAKLGNDSLKKQEEMFNSMEAQYEVARTATHTMRGVGLGFGSFQR